MRHLLTLTAAFTVGAMVMAAEPRGAAAGPVVSAIDLNAAPTAVENVGYWRRYCRRYGCPPYAVPEVDVDVDGPPVVVEEGPVVMPVVPLRPLSCGEYRYWNGVACVDARYNDPYLGPR
jgi:hypothetical protein